MYNHSMILYEMYPITIDIKKVDKQLNGTIVWHFAKPTTF